MRALGVVVLTPALDHDLRLGQAVEDLAVEQFGLMYQQHQRRALVISALLLAVALFSLSARDPGYQLDLSHRDNGSSATETVTPPMWGHVIEHKASSGKHRVGHAALSVCNANEKRGKQEWGARGIDEGECLNQTSQWRLDRCFLSRMIAGEYGFPDVRVCSRKNFGCGLQSCLCCVDVRSINAKGRYQLGVCKRVQCGRFSNVGHLHVEVTKYFAVVSNLEIAGNRDVQFKPRPLFSRCRCDGNPVHVVGGLGGIEGGFSREFGLIQSSFNEHDAYERYHNRTKTTQEHEGRPKSHITLGVYVAICLVCFALGLRYLIYALDERLTVEPVTYERCALASAIYIVTGIVFSGYVAWWWIF